MADPKMDELVRRPEGSHSADPLAPMRGIMAKFAVLKAPPPPTPKPGDGDPMGGKREKGPPVPPGVPLDPFALQLNVAIGPPRQSNIVSPLQVSTRSSPSSPVGHPATLVPAIQAPIYVAGQVASQAQLPLRQSTPGFPFVLHTDTGFPAFDPTGSGINPIHVIGGLVAEAKPRAMSTGDIRGGIVFCEPEPPVDSEPPETEEEKKRRERFEKKKIALDDEKKRADEKAKGEVDEREKKRNAAKEDWEKTGRKWVDPPQKPVEKVGLDDELSSPQAGGEFGSKIEKLRHLWNEHGDAYDPDIKIIESLRKDIRTCHSDKICRAIAVALEYDYVLSASDEWKLGNKSRDQLLDLLDYIDYGVQMDIDSFVTIVKRPDPNAPQVVHDLTDSDLVDNLDLLLAKLQSLTGIKYHSKKVDDCIKAMSDLKKERYPIGKAGPTNKLVHDLQEALSTYQSLPLCEEGQFWLWKYHRAR